MDVNGPLHVVDYGGEGPPLVLVHGLGGSHLNWMLVGPSLAQHHHVMAIDLPGFGLTAPEGRSAGVRSQAQLVGAFIRQELGEPATIVGNSMGGLIGLLAAAETPELVSRLVLVAPALLPTELEVPSRERLRYLALPLLPVIGPRLSERLRNQKTPEEQTAVRLQFVTADVTRLPDEVRIAGIAMDEERRRMPWATEAFAEAGRSTAAVLMRRRNFVAMLHSIGAPVLVIHGERDAVVPVAEARRLATLRPDWEVVTMENVGHVPQLEVAPEFVRLVTDFLDRTARFAPVVVSR